MDGQANPWLQTISVGEAFKVMELYIRSHQDIIEPSEEVGWFVSHILDPYDPAHERAWFDAVNTARNEDAD